MKRYKTLSALSSIWVFFGALNFIIAILYVFGAVGSFLSSVWEAPAGQTFSWRGLEPASLILGAWFFGGGLFTLTVAHLIKLAINVADCLHKATEPEPQQHPTISSDEPVPPV